MHETEKDPTDLKKNAIEMADLDFRCVQGLATSHRPSSVISDWRCVACDTRAKRKFRNRNQTFS